MNVTNRNILLCVCRDTVSESDGQVMNTTPAFDRFNWWFWHLALVALCGFLLQMSVISFVEMARHLLRFGWDIAAQNRDPYRDVQVSFMAFSGAIGLLSWWGGDRVIKKMRNGPREQQS